MKAVSNSMFAIGCASAVVMIFLVWYFYPFYALGLYEGFEFTEFELKHIGEFGDAFGGINALFSGLALCFVALTLFFQSRELRATIKEVRGQKEAILAQNETLHRQSFDSAFFQLLGAQETTRNDIRELDGQVWITGRPALELIMERLRRGNNKRQWDGISQDATKSTVEAIYKEFWLRYRRALGPYIGNIDSTLRLIDATDGIDKESYVRIVRNLLSHAERTIIVYHCLYIGESDPFTDLVVQLNLFGEFPMDVLLDGHHREFARIIFGDIFNIDES